MQARPEPEPLGPTRTRTFRPDSTRALRSKIRPDPSPKKRDVYPAQKSTEHKEKELLLLVCAQRNREFFLAKDISVYRWRHWLQRRKCPLNSPGLIFVMLEHQENTTLTRSQCIRYDQYFYHT